MKNFLKKYWGLIPISAFTLFGIFSITYKSIAKVTLRSTPMEIMVVGTAISFCLLFAWLFWFLYNFASEGKSKIFYVLYTLACVVVSIVMCLSIFFIGVFNVLYYKPEQVVERNGVKMVVCEDPSGYGHEEYYEYHNVLFRDLKQ